MSEVKVNKISPRSGTDVQLGDSGDTITVPTGATLDLSNATQTGVGGANVPAFDVSASSTFLIPNNTITKVEFDTVNLDTNSYWDGVTNYRFTPLVAGKYFVYTNLQINENNSNSLDDTFGYIYKNGVAVLSARQRDLGNRGTGATCNTSGILDMNGSTDYIESFAFMNSSAHTGTSEGVGALSNFGAFKIID